MTIQVSCSDCSTEHSIIMSDQQFNAWKGGALIQRVAPELSDSQRELLISGSCGECFDALFDEDPE